MVINICPHHAGVRHDAGDAGVRVPGVPVARQPRRAHDVRAGGLGAAGRRRRLRQRARLQELRRPPLEEQHPAHLHGVSGVSRQCCVRLCIIVLDYYLISNNFANLGSFHVTNMYSNNEVKFSHGRIYFFFKSVL